MRRLLLLAFCLASVTLVAGSLPQGEPTVKLLFTGDIMLDSLVGEDIARGHDPFADFAEILAESDLTIGNLECVVATKGEPMKDKPWTFRAHPRVLALVRKHLDLVTLANNHTGDFGHEAFLEQLDLLTQQKIPYFGGGRNLVEARTPRIVEKNGIRIALLGYNEMFPREFEAGPNWPGVAWLVEEQVVADIQAARTLHKADLVIPVLHWGWEEYLKPSKQQKKWARLFIESGADLVVGGHPHVTQGAEYHQGKLIIYSLGNFVFDGFRTQATRTGWLLRVEMAKTGMKRWDTVPIWLDERGTPRRVLNIASPLGKAGDDKIDVRTYR